MDYREDYNKDKETEERKEAEHCTQCPNQCPADDLRCERGKAAFGEGKEHSGAHSEEGWHGHEHDEEGWHGHGEEGWHGRGHGYHYDKEEYYKAYGHSGRMEWEAGPKDELGILISKCGCELYGRIVRDHGRGISYDPLSKEEQVQLAVLLKKLLDGWK